MRGILGFVVAADRGADPQFTGWNSPILHTPDMFAFFQRRPALGLLLSAWCLPILMVILSDPLLDRPVTLGTWILIGSCIGAASLGLLVGPTPLVKPSRMASDRLVLGIAIFGGICGLIFWAMRGKSGTSMEETRLLVHGGNIGMGKEAYFFYFGGAASLMAIAAASEHRKPLHMMALTVLIGVTCWAGFMIHFAARIFAMLCIAIAICGALTRFPKQIVSPRGIALGIAFIIPLFALNVMFAEKRMESKFADPYFGEYVTSKAATLIRVQDGGIRANSFVISGAWLLLQFSSDPIYFLDFYRTLDVSHDYGLYQFSLISNRVPGYDWQDRRNELNEMYEPIGVTTNVWGSGIRDVAIDFGEVGAVIMFFIMGFATARMGAARTIGGRSLGVFLMLWLLFSPFTTPITQRPYQMGLYLLVVWHFMELRHLRKAEGVRPMARRSAIQEPRGSVEAAAS